jgi:hypothetical protein
MVASHPRLFDRGLPGVNYPDLSHCRALIVTQEGPLPHRICYRR